MPSITAAPLSYTGGALRTSRIAPARVRYSGNRSLIVYTNTPYTEDAAVPQLDRLTRFENIVDGGGKPDQRFMAIWQDAMEKIEESFAAVNARIDQVALYQRIATVEALAQTANDNATVAQTTATQAAAATQDVLTTIDPVYGAEFDERFNEGLLN